MTTPLRSLRLIPKATPDLERVSGEPGEIFLDKTAHTIKIFDGKIRGGIALLRADLSNLETTGGSTVDFGGKIISASEFIGDVTGAVTGTVSNISNHSIDNLSDVNTSAATAGQLLGFDGTVWEPVSLSGSFNGGTISGTLKINNNTASTSSTTGALTVTGGVGISGATHLGSTLTVSGNTAVTGSVSATTTISATTEISVSSGPVSVKANNRLRLYDTDNTNFIGLRSPSNLTADFTFVLPGSYGTSGQFLQSNGSGGLTWATPVGGDGGGASNPPGGDTGSVQYSTGTGFGGNSSFTYDSTNDTLSLTNLEINGTASTTDLTITNSISTVDLTASGTITGNLTSSSVQITGGTITGNTQVSVTTLAASGSVSFTKNTNSTSSTTGGVVVTGGVGVGQDVNIGGKVSVNTTIAAIGNISSNSNISATDSITAGGNISATGNITAGNNVIINTIPSATTHATNKQYVDTRSLAMAIAMS